MELSEIATAQKAQALRNEFDVGVLKQALNQQELQGQAAVSLIDSSAQVQGAAEPGKGRLVDVRA